MRKNKSQIEQLDFKIKHLLPGAKITPPEDGWIKSARLALGMSLRQLASRLSITKQSVQELERRETEGSITVKSLRDAARALDMELVYGFVPRDGSLNALIERRARDLAREMVSVQLHQIKQSDPENFEKNKQTAIEERATLLKYELPKKLWD